MTAEEIKDIVDDIDQYIKTASAGELTGRIFELALEVEKTRDHEAALKTAIIVMMLKEK